MVTRLCSVTRSTMVPGKAQIYRLHQVHSWECWKDGKVAAGLGTLQPLHGRAALTSQPGTPGYLQVCATILGNHITGESSARNDCAQQRSERPPLLAYLGHLDEGAFPLRHLCQHSLPAKIYSHCQCAQCLHTACSRSAACTAPVIICAGHVCPEQVLLRHIRTRGWRHALYVHCLQLAEPVPRAQGSLKRESASRTRQYRATVLAHVYCAPVDYLLEFGAPVTDL